MTRGGRTFLVIIVAAVAVGAIVTVTYFNDINANGLPAGRVKPANGFLIIASHTGWNDSIGHGAPNKTWPIVSVKQNSTVDIVVCNIDTQAHSFQIAHYEPGSSNTMAPGTVLQFQFVADQKGTFQIYCLIFCTIHPYMQAGQLRVTT